MPVFDGGPIIEWWVTGFDGGDRHIVGVSTAVADYYLNEPSEIYEPFMEDLNRKAWITKVVVETLYEAKQNLAHVEYDDLLTQFETRLPYNSARKITSDEILKHADFVVNQVR